MLESIVENNKHTHLFEMTLERKKLVYKSIIGITNIEYEMLTQRKREILRVDEMTHLQSMPDVRQGESYLRSRFICKMAAGEYSGEQELKNIRIRHGVFSQPLLDGADRISVSHSGNFAACIVFPDEHPMGLDLEILQEDAAEKIGSQLTKQEMILTEKLQEDKNHSYTRCWTAKEALSKILMTGLMIPFQLLEITSVELGKKYDVSYFKNFLQYKSISCTLQNTMISLVMPSETNFKIEKIESTNKFI